MTLGRLKVDVGQPAHASAEVDRIGLYSDLHNEFKNRNKFMLREEGAGPEQPNDDSGVLPGETN